MANRRPRALAVGTHERESVKGNTPGTENTFRIVMRKKKNELEHDDGYQDKLSDRLSKREGKNKTLTREKPRSIRVKGEQSER